MIVDLLRDLRLGWRGLRRAPAFTAVAVAIIALVLIVTCPLFVGHQLINAKDGPFAVAMAILLGSLEIISLTPLSLSSLGAEEE